MTGRRPGASLEFRHVTKRYGPDGTPPAVNDLSLTVEPGEICALVGPSGGGKTTTLKMVNRLVEPTEGQVLIDDRDVAEENPTELRRRIGYVIQQVGLFPHRTIAQNVGTVPRLLGWPERRVRERVDELLLLIGLDPARVRDRYPSQLSGGEQQRVGVARAMAAQPPVMLMDEPFGAVDPIVRERLQDEFLRLHREQRMTVLFVTHDLDEAIKLGDRVAVLEQGGCLAQVGPPAELLAAPASEFVARLVGAERGLKRLALLGVRDAWLSHEPPPGGAALTIGADLTLRQALSRLLEAGVDAALVTSEDGRRLGVLTIEAIGSALRNGVAAPIDRSGRPGDTARLGIGGSLDAR